jgi:hypothetical protein
MFSWSYWTQSSPGIRLPIEKDVVIVASPLGLITGQIQNKKIEITPSSNYYQSSYAP